MSSKMTKQEIKDNAPHGATHEIWSLGERDLLRWDGFDWYILMEYQNREPEWVLTNHSILKEFSLTLKPL